MKKSLLIASVTFALAACSVPRSADQPLERWTNLENTSINADKLGDTQALAVFYRQDDIAGPSANIYIDTDYQASLMPNAFSAMPVCANKHTFSTSFVTNQKFGNRTDGITSILAAKQISYYKLVQEKAGRLSFVPVEESVAKQEIANLPKQTNTLSRVVTPNDCPPPVVLAVESLDANALFAFGGYKASQMTADSVKRIQDFAKKVKGMEYVESVKVNGHTDPVGSQEYNLSLSQRRADTVKSLLMKEGVTQRIEAVGYGKKELVVSNCDSLTGKAKTQCNAPNRRVDIAVYGGKAN